MNLIDTHAHIYSTKFDSDRDEVIESIRQAGISKVFMPNVDVETIDSMLECESRYRGLCVPMMGLHPCNVKEDFEQQLQVMEGWLNRRSFAAIGEIGIDLYWDKSTFDIQKEALTIQVEWAKKYHLPIVLHCRDSIDQTIELIEKAQDGSLTGIFHCFTGNLKSGKKNH
jgi:TatD DNase family protein